MRVQSAGYVSCDVVVVATNIEQRFKRVCSNVIVGRTIGPHF